MSFMREIPRKMLILKNNFYFIMCNYSENFHEESKLGMIFLMLIIEPYHN